MESDLAKSGVLYLSNKTPAYCLHTYSGQGLCIFDCHQTNERKIPYNVFEQLKNGISFTPKYGTRIHKPTKILVFMKFHPNLKMHSADRYIIIDVNAINK